MTDLLICESLFLITHDDDSGRGDGTLAIDNGLAGALLLDLASDELVVGDGTTIEPAPACETDDPLLAEALGVLRKSDRPRSAEHWVQTLPRELKPLGAKVGGSLVGRGILEQEQKKVLGLIPTTRWPEVDPAPERELRERLTRVLEDGAEPDPHTGLLIAILSPLGLVPKVVAKEHRKEAGRRAKAIAESDLAGPTSAAVKSAVDAIQLAVMTAVIVPAAVSASS